MVPKRIGDHRRAGMVLAAARTIAGPPISICSTQSSTLAPDSTVWLNGYKLTTTSSKASIPSCSRAAACSDLRRSASSPACTRGCSVLTRPSSTSGKPVSCSTGVTGIPVSAMVLAVDPVEMISTPAALRPCARSTSPVLSYTLISARRIGRLPSSVLILWLPFVPSSLFVRPPSRRGWPVRPPPLPTAVVR